MRNEPNSYMINYAEHFRRIVHQIAPITNLFRFRFHYITIWKSISDHNTHNIHNRQHMLNSVYLLGMDNATIYPKITF